MSKSILNPGQYTSMTVQKIFCPCLKDMLKSSESFNDIKESVIYGVIELHYIYRFGIWAIWIDGVQYEGGRNGTIFQGGIVENNEVRGRWYIKPISLSENFVRKNRDKMFISRNGDLCAPEMALKVQLVKV